MHFVIAGRVDCKQFVFASMLANQLKNSLPEFSYSRIAKKSGDWEKWLLKTCKENDWYHIKSPIIWREIAMTKGKKYLVGDITKFLDLCQDFYGIKKDMVTGENFLRSEMQWYAERSEINYVDDMKKLAEEHISYRCRQVCILGAGCQACDVLIMELLHIPLQNRENGLEIRLHDEMHRMKKLKSIADDAKYCLGYSGLGSCRIAYNLREALYNVDLVIVLDSFSRRSNESLEKWLKRNRNAMCVLGNSLNKYANTHCRVIIGSPSDQPICYNATVLASFATKLHVRNIVAVTQDLGRETLTHLARKIGCNLKDLNCPPVWGFVGLNKFVDLRNTLETYLYKVPGHRISKTLSQGTEELQIRTVDPFLEKQDINSIALSVYNHKLESMPRLGRVSQLAKITAILDLLKVWSLKQEDGNGEILSLGVYSDGTFNIPEGLYWSQPVTLEKGFWKPFARYPIPRRLDINIETFFTFSVASLFDTNVKVRKHKDPKPIKKKKESNKFDLNILREAVQMPVIMTKDECLIYIKMLAKKEMNYEEPTVQNMDALSETMQSSTIEAVPPEKIYCECWRQEILQLRKMATELSTTTEIEVDLSENLSGSEWSVVNPPELSILSDKQSSTLTEVTKSSSGTVVCECEEECNCLAKNVSEKSEEESFELESESMTQDSQFSIFNNMDQFHYEKKNVRFDPEVGPCSGKAKNKYKFYGTRNSVEQKKSQNPSPESSISDKGYSWDGAEEIGEQYEPFSSGTNEFMFFQQKFHVSINENYEIVGDQAGLEALEEMQRNGPKDAANDFKEMWADEVTPALQVLSSDTETSTSSAEISLQSRQTVLSSANASSSGDELPDGNNIVMVGEDEGEEEQKPPEDDLRFRTQLEVIHEVEAEDDPDAETKPEPEPKEKVPGETPEVQSGSEETPDNLEGIPERYVCRCVHPPAFGCNCDEKKVVEMFKQEADKLAEIDQTLAMESPMEGEYEEMLRPEDESEEEEKEEEMKQDLQKEDEVVDKENEEEMEEFEDEEEGDEEEEEMTWEKKKSRDIFSLPPESFFPFSPKPINKFVPTEKQSEMETDSKNILNKLPYEYRQMLEETKNRVAEEMRIEEENRDKNYRCSKDNPNFERDEASQLMERTLLDKCEIKNWRSALKKKCMDWFDNGKSYLDDLYYEAAAEEPSDEECEINKELRKYFEP